MTIRGGEILNFFSLLNDYQGPLTLLVLVSQAYIMYRQTKATEKTVMLELQRQPLLECLIALKEAKSFFFEVQSSSLSDPQEKDKNLDLANRGRKILADLAIKSREASIFFDKAMSKELETWSSGLAEKRGKRLIPFETRLHQILVSNYDETQKEKDIKDTFKEAISLTEELDQSREKIIKLIKKL